MWNDDLRPCTLAEHSWPGSKFAALWVGMCLCLPTYSLASGMIALGMNWWESVLTILIGCIVVMAAILLVSHAGNEVRHSLSGFCAALVRHARRASACTRARLDRRRMVRHQFLVRRLGARCDSRSRAAVLERDRDPHLAIAFAVFWAINVLVAMRGPQAIGRLAQFSAPTLAVGRDRVVAMGAAKRAWLRADARSAGNAFTAPRFGRSFIRRSSA